MSVLICSHAQLSLLQMVASALQVVSNCIAAPPSLVPLLSSTTSGAPSREAVASVSHALCFIRAGKQGTKGSMQAHCWCEGQHCGRSSLICWLCDSVRGTYILLVSYTLGRQQLISHTFPTPTGSSGPFLDPGVVEGPRGLISTSCASCASAGEQWCSQILQ